MFQNQCLDITPQLYWWANGVLQRDTQTNKWECEGQASSLGIYNWDRRSSFEIFCYCAAYEGGTGTKTLLGVGGDVKVKLCETLPSSQNYKVFADYLFSSAPLLFKLLQRQIYCVGILRNRLAVCQLEDENNLAKRKRKRICWFKSGERGQYGHSLVVRQQICCPDLILLCSWAPGWSSMLEQIRQGIWWGQQATHCEGVQHIHEWGRLPWCMRCKVQLPHEFTEGLSLPVRINRHVRPC